ncbi:MAG: sigma-70 family RNA polymerase sigma factor [Planctomycetes bacterium]|nr:sigma-70 family RNA polymerase sigma factor [Planctomycetota bacterium]MBI3843065.1 sigma-70 family RNA polymerase sigma factor [Planctomycetota bacterium]
MKKDEPDTVELLRRWHSGDSEALGEIVTRHSEWISRYVHGRIGAALRSKAETGDIVQEAFLVLLRSGPRFVVSNSKHFRCVIARMIENVIRDQVNHFNAICRETSRERPLSDTVIDLDPPKNAVRRPSEEAQERENEAFMRLGLELLESDDRRVILLRYFDELPFAAVGKYLGITDAAAAMRFRRALARLGKMVALLRKGRLDEALAATDGTGDGGACDGTEPD